MNSAVNTVVHCSALWYFIIWLVRLSCEVLQVLNNAFINKSRLCTWLHSKGYSLHWYACSLQAVNIT